MTFSSPDPDATPACIIYGIPNCDQVKKARAWLVARGVPARFHDFRRDGLNPSMLTPWLAKVGWEALINRKGTTWRGLTDAQRPGNEADAILLMLAQPAVIKRPVLEVSDAVLVGFSETAYSQMFSSQMFPPRLFPPRLLPS